MRPEDAQELIGQRRVWVMDLKANGPKPTDVTCVKATGGIMMDGRGAHISIHQVWCEYKLHNGKTDTVWFTPEKFKTFAVSEEVNGLD